MRVAHGSSTPNLDRFVQFDAYETNLPTLGGSLRVGVELLVDPDSIDGFWAVIPAAGVAAAGESPTGAALAAMRAATAMLSIEPETQPAAAVSTTLQGAAAA